MARRKKQSAIEELVRSPWWISAMMAVVSFVALRWLIPSSLATSPMLAVLGTMFKSLAWLAACGFGVIAFISFFVKKRSAQLSSNAPKLKMQKMTASTDNFTDKAKWEIASTPSSPSISDVMASFQIPIWSIDSLRSLEWKRFELLCAKYYEAAGFKAVTMASGADGGIDIKLFKLDPHMPIAIVQCKAWSGAVGVKEIRELLGVMTHEKVMRGIFITNSTYTPDALAFGHVNPIQLLDGQAFLRKIQNLDLASQDKLTAFAFEGDYKTPTCASCGIKLVNRGGKRGTLWGCVNYPRCKTTMNLKSEK